MNLPQDLRAGINELLEVKKVTVEGELNPQIPVIYEFIKGELENWKKKGDEMADDHRKEWGVLNQMFMEVIDQI